MPTASQRSQDVRTLALELGFDAVGIARVRSLIGTPEGDRYLAWIADGRHGGMKWLAREPERRLDPARVLAGAASVICVALSHWAPAQEPGEAPVTGPGPSGRVARYARGRDYHKVFEGRLKRLEAAILEAYPSSSTRRYVDHGPVLEKLWAERAGLGWRGKHTNLVSRGLGSWFLLGDVLTDLDLEPDAPEEDHCGTCERCVEACPTGAITGPYQLDARRCISYLTIEHRGSIPLELRPLIGDYIFGCDDCLDVCPWNRFARETREADFHPRAATLAPLLVDLVGMTSEAFVARFAGTPVMRARREGLARNACVALGNVGGEGAVAALEGALLDESPLVREHAAWALDRLTGGDPPRP